MKWNIPKKSIYRSLEDVTGFTLEFCKEWNGKFYGKSIHINAWNFQSNNKVDEICEQQLIELFNKIHDKKIYKNYVFHPFSSDCKRPINIFLKKETLICNICKRDSNLQCVEQVRIEPYGDTFEIRMYCDKCWKTKQKINQLKQ